jgi:hypothetical protein
VCQAYRALLPPMTSQVPLNSTAKFIRLAI